MDRVQRTIVCLILAAASTVQLLGLVVAKLPLANLYEMTATEPLFMSTVLAISILALRRGEVVHQILVGVALSIALLVLLLMCGNGFSLSSKAATLGFWCGSIVVSGHRVVRTSGAERIRELDRTLVIVALPLVVPLTFVGLWLAAQIIDRAYDNYFYAFDGLLPVQAARILAQYCATHPWAWSASSSIYNSFMLVLCAFIALQWRQDREVPPLILTRWVIATMVGYGLYYCLPGVGPDVAFYGTPEPRFDSLPSPYQVELTTLGGFDGKPRNAMPSLHATWAFLIALAALRMAIWIRVLGISFAIAIAIVTLGVREHYLIDLVVAVPFAVAVHAGTGLLERTKEAKAPLSAALGGAAMTVAWLLIIRYATASLRNVPEIASMLVIGTLAASAWLVFRMETERREMVERRRNQEPADGAAALAA